MSDSNFEAFYAELDARMAIPDDEDWHNLSERRRKLVRRCAATLTSSIPLGMLTPQEVRIHAAVENTLREICRRLDLLWA